MSAGDVATAFLSGLELVAGPQKRVVDQLGQFAAHFSRAAVEKLAVAPAQGHHCTMSDCGGEAVLFCLICDTPVCLAHAHVSHRAEGICDQCVRAMLQARGKPPPVSRPTREQEIRSALRTLGLTADASWSEVQKTHRRLVAASHPDRAKTATERRRLEERAKRLNAAFAVLRRDQERA